MSTSKYCLEIYCGEGRVRESIIEKAKKDGKTVLYHNNHTHISCGTDSGIDMFCADGGDILPGDTSLVGLGVKCRMVDTSNPGVTVGYYMYPRSSIYKTPLRLVNSVGIIDKDYRGELKAPLQNNPNVSTYLVDFTAGVDVVEKYTYTIESYSRLVQICAPDLSPLSVAFVDELDNTSRGSGGFGSTGI